MNWFNLPEAIAEIAKDIKYLIRLLLTQKRILIDMSDRLDKIKYLKSQVVSLSASNADLSQKLVDALSNDAADAQAIATAQAEADTAKTEAQTAKDALAPLQGLADADATEDAGIDAELADVEIPTV